MVCWSLVALAPAPELDDLGLGEVLLIVDPCRQVKASQPWFLVLPGPAGLEQVSVLMYPDSLFLQGAL